MSNGAALVSILVLLGLALGVTVRSGAAEELTLTLDPEASTITFTLGAVLHTVEGSFRLEQGEVHFDPETGVASGRLVVDATSGNTGNDGRDEDMHTKVLESARYPDFVFTPTRLEGTFAPSGTSEVTLQGTLEIHGTAHEIAIPVTAAVSPGPDGRRLEATGSFEVPYVEWGMEDPGNFLLSVDDVVDVSAEAVGRIDPPPR